MNILSVEGITKSYSERVLFDEISLGINEGEKIGLIGINGTGKSTLLKVIAGVEQVDSGRIIKGSSISIEYLPQNPYFCNGVTVLQQVFRGSSPAMQMLREYEQILDELEKNPDDSSNEKRLAELSHIMDAIGAWAIEKDAKNILTRLGITDFQADTGLLSGGQKKRVAMASALINPADLLILDEPTNHIDNDTVDWLENYLNKRKGALLIVTHDRYFLDRVVNRILELDNGRLFSYQANYGKYLEMKIEREELEQASERKRQSLMRTELEWIKRGARARTTKQKARIDRFEKLQGEKQPDDYEGVEIKAGAARLGKKIIELEHVEKGFDDLKLIDNFNYIIQRDDRIGIIGPNGCGKTTILRIIAGMLTPDSGCVKIGETVKIGFFSQDGDEMDESLRVIEYIREQAEFIITTDGSVSASQMLERFLFPPEVQWTPIAKLSGGEKRRLYLLRVLMGSPNVLLLDEPTNDLDIHTLSVLESYIDDFPGVVAAVSHDRYFLDRIANKLFSFEGNGVIKQYNGNYSYYHECIRESDKETVKDSRKLPADKIDRIAENKKDKPVKFTYKEQKEFEKIEEVISGMETMLQGINKEINEAASDFARLQVIVTNKESLEKQLHEAIERWAYLNEISENIMKQKSSSQGGSND